MTLKELDEVAYGLDYEGILWGYLEAQPGSDEERFEAVQKFRRNFPTFEKQYAKVVERFGDWPVTEVKPGDGEIIVRLGKPGGPR